MANFIIKEISEVKLKEFKAACDHFKISMNECFLHVIDLTILKYGRDGNWSKVIHSFDIKEEKGR